MLLCDAGVTHDCVTQVKAKGPDGVEHVGTYVEDFPGKTKYSFEGNPNLNLPDGSSSFIVRFPDVPHSKGDLYLVSVNLDGSKHFDENRFHVSNFSAGIFAVTIVNGDYYPANPAKELKYFQRVGSWTYQRIAFNKGSLNYATCAQATETRCAVAWPLPTDTEFSLTLRLRTKINGWLHGRLTDVTSTIGTASDGDQLVTVAGKPVVVPAIYQWFHLSDMPKPIEDFYKNNDQFMRMGTGFSNSQGSSILKDYINYEERSFPEALAWYSAIGDKASSAATAWSFRSIEGGNLPQQCKSSSSQLTGIVTTNSNMFVAQPPTFNTFSQTLDYKVSSPHYLADGTIFKGNYNLLMRSDYARCIYGFTKAPVSGSISIVSADGTTQVATSVLGEKNGWLYLAANNFTFSSPTLKVKLTQETLAPVKTTITCKKGKTTKKVTAVKPVCPAGYKKA